MVTNKTTYGLVCSSIAAQALLALTASTATSSQIQKKLMDTPGNRPDDIQITLKGKVQTSSSKKMKLNKSTINRVNKKYKLLSMVLNG
ncbi:unnamed protein product [Orchesella dallaii]|uniref:Uncharacterized protein n=1 Tax=Orchesella dallaii TaxID=48710 RepID=A0ABP1PTF0_9HEXA